MGGLGILGVLGESLGGGLGGSWVEPLRGPWSPGGSLGEPWGSPRSSIKIKKKNIKTIKQKK